MAESTVGERLAVLESEHENQSEDIREILKEVKRTGALLVEVKTKVDALSDDNLDHRLTKVETRQKVYGSIAAAAMTFVAGLSLFKESIVKLFI